MTHIFGPGAGPVTRSVLAAMARDANACNARARAVWASDEDCGISPRVARMLVLIDGTRTATEVAVAAGVTRQAVRDAAIRHGVEDQLRGVR